MAAIHADSHDFRSGIKLRDDFGRLKRHSWKFHFGRAASNTAVGAVIST